MKALIKTKFGVELKDTAEPNTIENYVKIKVSIVGLCRTDLKVASGEIPRDNDIVLGHEFSGVVVETKSSFFRVGD